MTGGAGPTGGRSTSPPNPPRHMVTGSWACGSGSPCMVATSRRSTDEEADSRSRPRSPYPPLTELPRDHPGAPGRRSGDGSGGLPDDPWNGGRSRGYRRTARRRTRGVGGGEAATRRGPDGYSDADRRWARGHAADHRVTERGEHEGVDPHDLRARRLH